MKKKLEADLISIAHRILQIKDKSDINQLYLETQKLYEKLSVLKFIDENYGDVKPTIGSYSEIEKEVESFYDKDASLPVETEIEMTESNIYPETKAEEAIVAKEEESVAPETADSVIETVNPDDEIPSEEIVAIEEAELEEKSPEFHEVEPEIEEENEEENEEEIAVEKEPEFKNTFELNDAPEIEEFKKSDTVQISFEDLLGLNYNEPEFVKVEDVPAPAKDIVFESAKEEEIPVQKAVESIEKNPPRKVSLNDSFSKGIDIDLNDRIAFVKHLFGNSSEDYNRVMNQLITYDNFFETKRFLDEMVKPDYNDWKGKEEYEDRFMEIIEKKFL